MLEFMYLFLLTIAGAAEAQTVVSPSGYSIETATVGGKTYSDRAFVWSNLGDLEGSRFILAKNTDKTSVSVVINYNGKIIVAADKREKNHGLPSSFIDLKKEITSTDATYRLFESDVSGQATILPVCKSGACNTQVIFFKGGGIPVESWTGVIKATWGHNYKSVPGKDGVVKDVDVDHFVLRYGKAGIGRREVQDNDTGSISTEFHFGDVPAGHPYPRELGRVGDNWCLSVSAVAFEKIDGTRHRAESEKSDQTCVILDAPEPEHRTIPVKPSGVTIHATNKSGSIELTLEPAD